MNLLKTFLGANVVQTVRHHANVIIASSVNKSLKCVLKRQPGLMVFPFDNSLDIAEKMYDL
jgi:hypothetical protein